MYYSYIKGVVTASKVTYARALKRTGVTTSGTDATATTSAAARGRKRSRTRSRNRKHKWTVILKGKGRRLCG